MVNMAHVACHRGEPSPHSYTTSRLSERDHGAVSEYETLNIPHKLHTKFKADSEISDDFIPLMPAPPPSWPTALLQRDPTLCVTPDKSKQGLENLHNNVINTVTAVPSLPKPDPSLCLTPEQLVNTKSRIKFHTTKSRSEMVPAEPTLLEPDPLLAVTPEKPIPVISTTKSSLRTDKNDALAKLKLKHKVRFDIDSPNNELKDKDVSTDLNLDSEQGKIVGSKVYQPKLYAGIDKSNDTFFDEEDQPRTLVFTVAGSDESNAFHKAFGNNKDTEKSISDNMQLKCRKYSNSQLIQGIESIKTPVELSERADHVIPKTNKSPPKRKVVVTREFQERPVITEYQFPFDCEDVSSEMEHVFSRPEFHNSLKVYSEMKELGCMVPDVATALDKHLNCEEKRTEISEKASSKVNQSYSSSQYSGLVGLDAPIDHLCLKTEKLITTRVRPDKHQLRKAAAGHEPDLMEFFHSELEKEAPDLQLTGMSTPSEGLAIAHQCLAFDLYRHNRVWEGVDWK